MRTERSATILSTANVSSSEVWSLTVCFEPAPEALGAAEAIVVMFGDVKYWVSTGTFNVAMNGSVKVPSAGRRGLRTGVTALEWLTGGLEYQ